MARRKTFSPLGPRALALVAARFKLLGEPARLALLNALMQHEMSVSELVQATGMGQANVSKQLALLAEAGYVSRRKQGLFTVYSIADETVYQLCELMCGSIEKKLGSDLKAVA